MLKDLILQNRSYRGYDHARKVSREELLELIDIARLCPSSVNRQPLKYLPACDEEMVRTIQKETRWAKGLPQMQLPHPGKEPAAFIVICQDDRIDPNLSRYQRDLGITAQSMLLRAAEMGLGGCMIGNFSAEAVKKVLSLPENLHPLLIVAIGKPDEEVIITEIGADESTGYYRDEQDRHYVPKRKLDDIIVKL